MAPANQHLAWQEVRDFSPGLWTVSTALMPPNAAQVMTDCYPSQGGGLRAWFKPSNISTTGIANLAQEAVIGMASRGGVAIRAGGGDTSDRYLATYSSTDNNVRLYRMDLTAAATTWTLIKLFAAGLPAPNPMTFVVYQLVAGGVLGAVHMIVNLYQTSADDGVWSVNYADSAVAKILGANGGPVAVHQSRLIAGRNDGNVAFTGPGNETFGTNLVVVEPSRQLSAVTGMQSYSPGDLLLFKRGAPIFLVEGDLTDYTLRQMNDSKNPNTLFTPSYTPDGLAFVCGNDGIYITPEGQTIIPKSQALLPGTWVGTGTSFADVVIGDVSFTGHWMVAPRGYVMDYSTGAWFSSSFLSGAAGVDGRHHCIDRAYQLILAATGGRSFSLYQYDTSEDTAHRAESFTWKSAPLRDPSGRQLQIREVQVAGQAFGAASTVAVTVNGTARNSPVISGRFNESFLFRESAELLDVQVVSASNTVGVEAPMVEAVRIGSRSMHLIY